MRTSQFIKTLKKLPSFFLIVLFRLYRSFISPIYPGCCRFYPTCSIYAIKSIQKYGVLKGIYLTTKRILRCNPFCKGGEDPVP